jgi:hypothetical protein
MNKKNILTKKNILVAIITIWITFSIGYITYDQWKNFQAGQLQTAYYQGVTDSIQALVIQSEKCLPIPLYEGEDKKVEMIAVSCLEQTPEQTPEQQPEQE